MQQEKLEEARRRILKQLKGKVRPHRPAAKVLEITIAITEDQIESMKDKITRLEVELEYIRGLDAAGIEEDDKCC
jgi:hypothetical protein